MKMSVWWLSLACQQSVFQRYHSKTFIKMAAKANWHWNYVTFTLCIDIFGTLCRRHHLTCQNSKWSPQWGYLGKYMKYHSRARGSFLFFDRLFAHASSQNHTTDFYAVCIRTLTCHLLLWHNRCCCDVISLTDASLYRNSCTLSFFSQTTVVCQVIITVPVRLLFTTTCQFLKKTFNFFSFMCLKVAAQPLSEYAHILRLCRRFYPRDAMLAPCVCLSVCLSVSIGVLLKWLNESSWFLLWDLPSIYPSLCYEDI